MGHDLHDYLLRRTYLIYLNFQPRLLPCIQPFRLAPKEVEYGPNSVIQAGKNMYNIITCNLMNKIWQNGTIPTTAYAGLLRGTLTWDSYVGIGNHCSTTSRIIDINIDSMAIDILALHHNQSLCRFNPLDVGFISKFLG